jgi:hypothetical protein
MSTLRRWKFLKINDRIIVTVNKEKGYF